MMKMEFLAVLALFSIAVLIPLLGIWRLILLRRISRQQQEQANELTGINRQLADQSREISRLKTRLETPEPNVRPTAEPVAAPPPEPEPIQTVVAATMPPPEPVMTVKPEKTAEPESVAVAARTESEVPSTTEIPPEATAAEELPPPPPPFLPPPRHTAFVPPPPEKPSRFQESMENFERSAAEVLRKIWTWFIVGEDFRKQGVSAEYAVSTTWLVRIAVITILSGVGFGLQYSIAHGMLPPAARVSLALAGGLALLITGLRLCGNKYRLIGTGLTGAGIVTLYFCAFAAHALYHLIPFNLAFPLMLLVTVTAGVLALRINSLLTAVIGVLGGYVTPVLLSTGVKNLPGLYGYMLLIGLGALLINIYRNWRLLHYLSFVCIWGLFFASMDRFYQPGMPDILPAMGFMTAFFILFSVQPLWYLIRVRAPITILELGLLLVNLILFFGESCYLIGHSYGQEWNAAVSVPLTGFYLLQLGFYHRLKLKDPPLYNLLLVFAAFALTVTIPLLLTGEAITAAWAIQAPLFLWLSLRTSSRVIRILSYLIYALTLGRMTLLDFHHCFTYIPDAYMAGLKSRLTTLGMLTASLAAGYYILRRAPQQPKPATETRAADAISRNITAKDVMFWAGFASLFLLLHYEFYYISLASVKLLYVPLQSLVWLGAILYFACCLRRTGQNLYRVLIVFGLLGLTAKLVFFDLDAWHFNPMRDWLYTSGFFWRDIALRTLNALPILAVAVVVRQLIPADEHNAQIRNLIGVGALILLFVFLTLELNFLLYHLLPSFRAGGISVYWGLYALALLIGGIVRNRKPLRFAGLALFSVTALKIFFLDLRHLETGARIIAFILLGFVMLAAAGIYIKFSEKFKVTGHTGEKDNPQI